MNMSTTATAHTESLETVVAQVTAFPTVRTDFLAAFEFLEYSPPAVLQDNLCLVAAGVMTKTMEYS